MNLHIELKPNFEGSIQIIDHTRYFDEYIPEDFELILPRYYNFKYSDTITLNVLRYAGLGSEEIINVVYSSHKTYLDSIRIELPKDGYYIVDHVILPTYEWYLKVKNEDLSEYQIIYIAHNDNIYKVIDGNFIKVDIQEVIERNPERTTISCKHFQTFCIDRLKNCFISANNDVVNNFFKKNCYSSNCNAYTVDTFNRDFLFMTIHAIEYLLELELYEEALRLLDLMTCYNFCPNESNLKFSSSSCGCKK